MLIHFVGCRGASMSRLMAICRSRGDTVTGSDSSLGFGHSRDNIHKNLNLVVYTNAVKEDNCELVRAREFNIPLVERAEFLGQLSKNFAAVFAVSGTHGKTTTSGLLCEILRPLGCTMHIGGEYNQDNSGNFFVTEACEYKRSFLSLCPTTALILNAELDHTDYFVSYNDYFSAFKEFAKKSKRIITFGDDENLFNLAKEFNGKTFGLNYKNDYQAKNIKSNKFGTEFDFYFLNEKICRLKINTFGTHNVLNALAAASVAYENGVDISLIKSGLLRCRGVKRRFELLAKKFNTNIYSDYAHHPSEIAALLKGVKEQRFSSVTIIFEPHTYTRTASLKKEFAKELLNADNIFIMPVFAAREVYNANGDSKVLYKELLERVCNSEMKNTSIEFFPCFDSLYDKLDSIIEYNKKHICTNAIIFTGAGTIDKYAREFCE